ncbi:hypothetical protein LY78DRAFT_653707 [Colletotrichum sublineola]|nr:hypothetical protein LY78DRAFT_653707 [Colletotrichum sublineola]
MPLKKMYALAVLFASLPLLAGLAGAQGLPNHNFCCSNTPQRDIKQVCGDPRSQVPPPQLLCCDLNSNADTGTGCHDNNSFPVGSFAKSSTGTICNTVGTFLCV